MEENNCFYISNFGIIKSIDQKPIIKDPKNFIYNFNYNNLFGESIYIMTNNVENFFDNHLHLFINPIILVTGSNTNSVPDSIKNIDKYINHPKLLKWFAQNYVGGYNYKIHYLPLGLDYHTLSFQNHNWGSKMTPLEQEQILINIKKKFKPIQNTNTKIALANFQHTTYGNPLLREERRKPILEILLKKNCIKFLPTQKRSDFWETLNDYAFMVSPPGYGYDTHRTWEILILGRIPIISECNINNVYKDLPIIIVKDWNIIDENWLNEKYKEIIKYWSFYNWKKLELKYWTNLIIK